MGHFSWARKGGDAEERESGHSGGCLIEREVGGRVLGAYEFIFYDSPQVSGGRLM